MLSQCQDLLWSIWPAPKTVHMIITTFEVTLNKRNVFNSHSRSRPFEFIVMIHEISMGRILGSKKILYSELQTHRYHFDQMTRCYLEWFILIWLYWVFFNGTGFQILIDDILNLNLNLKNWIKCKKSCWAKETIYDLYLMYIQYRFTLTQHVT